jgi:hypothetical protein
MHRCDYYYLDSTDFGCKSARRILDVEKSFNVLQAGPGRLSLKKTDGKGVYRIKRDNTESDIDDGWSVTRLQSKTLLGSLEEGHFRELLKILPKK